MIRVVDVMSEVCVDQLQTAYRQIYGNDGDEYVNALNWITIQTFKTLARSTALYHNLEHTLLVTLVGQTILQGKQRLEGNVSRTDWFHMITALLCHDIGYVRGVCRHDRPNSREYAIGTGDERVTLPLGTTDASLTPYHVDRSQRYVEEQFSAIALIQVKTVNENIELTRFPIPSEARYQDTVSYPGLTRAADLIGQLSDPHYLQKTPALFYEFQETGMNQTLGYRHPLDLYLAYPTFYRTAVYPFIQDALRYLEATTNGRKIIASLMTNLLVAEQQRSRIAVPPVDASSALIREPFC